MTEEEKTEILLQILYDIGNRKKIIKELKQTEEDSYKIIEQQEEIINLLHRYICIYSMQLKRQEK